MERNDLGKELKDVKYIADTMMNDSLVDKSEYAFRRYGELRKRQKELEDLLN